MSFWNSACWRLSPPGVSRSGERAPAACRLVGALAPVAATSAGVATARAAQVGDSSGCIEQQSTGIPPRCCGRSDGELARCQREARPNAFLQQPVRVYQPMREAASSLTSSKLTNCHSVHRSSTSQHPQATQRKPRTFRFSPSTRTTSVLFHANRKGNYQTPSRAAHPCI